MRIMMRAYQLSALALVSAVLVGCGGNTKTIPNIPEQQLYQQAEKALDDGRYSAAVTELETLNSRFPFGTYAQQSQLDLIYGYYQVSNWTSAISQATTFILLHPNNPQVDYALYLRGLSHWQAGRPSLEFLSWTDISKRDLGDTVSAYADFKELVTRFPQSAYAADARQRIIYLRNVLARHELQAADFYLRKRNYVAATERGRWVVEHYPQTQASYDALAVMVEGYMGLQANDQARETLAILIHNDPKHPSLDGGTTFHPRYVSGTLSLNGQ